jgi:hypothetical protein
LQSVSRSAVVVSLEQLFSVMRPALGRERNILDIDQKTANAPATAPGLGVKFWNVAKEAGLNAKTIFGGEHKNKYLLETTGCGVAF